MTRQTDPESAVRCPACEQRSTTRYRCEHCGRNLVAEGTDRRDWR